jgi:acyl carrier protein
VPAGQIVIRFGVVGESQGEAMERQEIALRVKQVIGRVLKVDPAAIGDDDNFVFDLGADSMQSVQLVASFESEFNIEMEEQEALQVQTVSGAVDFIAGCLR